MACTQTLTAPRTYTMTSRNIGRTLNPAYQVDFEAIDSGKRIAATKRKVHWRFGFSNANAVASGGSGTACRGEEHDVALIWSISSGKRVVLLDGIEIYTSTVKASTFEHCWIMQGNHTCRIIAYSSMSPALSTNRNFRQYTLVVDGQCFHQMPKVFELGRGSRGTSGPPGSVPMSPAMTNGSAQNTPYALRRVSTAGRNGQSRGSAGYTSQYSRGEYITRFSNPNQHARQPRCSSTPELSGSMSHSYHEDRRRTENWQSDQVPHRYNESDQESYRYNDIDINEGHYDEFGDPIQETYYEEASVVTEEESYIQGVNHRYQERYDDEYDEPRRASTGDMTGNESYHSEGVNRSRSLY